MTTTTTARPLLKYGQLKRHSVVDSRHICLLLLLKTVVNGNVASASVSLHAFSFYGAL